MTCTMEDEDYLWMHAMNLTYDTYKMQDGYGRTTSVFHVTMHENANQ